MTAGGIEQALRRQAHDYVQRVRIVLGSFEATLVDKLNRDTVEAVTEAMCEHLGVRYFPPPDVPRRASDGRPSPWARKAKRGKVAGE